MTGEDRMYGKECDVLQMHTKGWPAQRRAMLSRRGQRWRRTRVQSADSADRVSIVARVNDTHWFGGRYDCKHDVS